jgi:hypothetical protein
VISGLPCKSVKKIRKIMPEKVLTRENFDEKFIKKSMFRSPG